MTTLVSYGGGTNSTAMLCGMVERRERPDAILFADTGGERPDTYNYVDGFSHWLKSKGFPEIIVVENLPTLEADCLKRNALPSVAYGFKSCSDRWKIRPQNRWVQRWPMALDTWKAGEKVTKCIGFDAGEPYRAEGKVGDERYTNRYPLIEWGWDRDACMEAIERSGQPQPGKSSCFFCPNSKQHEILALPVELQERAIAMEDNAELGSIKGLGRGYSWKNLIHGDRKQIKLFPVADMPCGCYDG